MNYEKYQVAELGDKQMNIIIHLNDPHWISIDIALIAQISQVIILI